MAIQKKWAPVPPQTITSNGTLDGHVTVPDATLFFVQMKVIVFSDTVGPMPLQIKRINNINDIELGPINGDINSRSNLTSILSSDNAKISAPDYQDRPAISMEDVIRAAYANEPAVAIRNLPVDELGDAFNVNNPLPVSSAPMWDEIDLSYDSNQDLDQVQYKKGATVKTLDLQYDANLNLSKVIKS